MSVLHPLRCGFTNVMLTRCRCRPSKYTVGSETGTEAQKYFFQELLDALEKIQPGISATLKAQEVLNMSCRAS